tara:strand:- start:16320 stop:17003 length:684 start_codon:yes stop_codon:yes gene_type:complete
MKVEDMINHYNRAGLSQDPYTIVRHEWSKDDFQNREDETVLNIFDFNFSGEETFLDLGCGLGYTANLVKDKVEKYIGVDAAFALLERAEQDHRNDSNVNFVLNNGVSIPYPNESFDIIVSEQVLQHVLECGTEGVSTCFGYLSDIKRCLKPNGKLCIQIPKKSAYRHGLSKDSLKSEFDESEINEYDNWYWTITRNITRNENVHWLNTGAFKERDKTIFGDKYVEYN